MIAWRCWQDKRSSRSSRVPSWRPTRGATIRTVDDQTISGEIKGFAAGELIVETKPAPAKSDAATKKIPLAEIAEVSFRASAVKPSSPSRPAKPKAGGVNLLGALFGATAPTPIAIPSTTYSAPTPYSTVSPARPSSITPPAVRTHHRPGTFWQIELAGGDHVSASLDGWSGDRLRLTVDDPAKTPLVVPVDRIRAIWSESAAMVAKAKSLDASAEGQDIAFVEKNGDVKSVAGVASGIDAGFLKFKYEGEERRIKLDRIAGLLLAQREIAAEKSLYETFESLDGDTLSGRIDSIDRGVVRLKPLFAVGDELTRIEIPLKELASIDVKNGRLTWLGDLRPSAVSQVPYFDRLMPYRVNRSLTGGELVLADGPVAKGIAVHTKCTLAYDIGGAFERFRAKVGFQQPEGRAGRAALRILGDGKILWQQADLHGDASQPTAIDLNVSKIQSLSLEADYGANFDVAGRIVWGEARLIK